MTKLKSPGPYDLYVQKIGHKDEATDLEPIYGLTERDADKLLGELPLEDPGDARPYWVLELHPKGGVSEEPQAFTTFTNPEPFLP